MAVTTIQPLAQAVDVDALLVWSPSIPPAWAVPVAAGTLWDAAMPGRVMARRPYAGGAPEGPQWFATVAPGLIKFGSVDRARGVRRAEKLSRIRDLRVRSLVGWTYATGMIREAEAFAARFGDPALLSQVPCPLGDPLLRPEARARITEWSTKSQLNMMMRLSTLDYGDMLGAGMPAMVTLTLPKHWQEIAPDGRTWKRLVGRFVKRYERAWGPLSALWKMEFQGREAPHEHLLMVPPEGYALCDRFSIGTRAHVCGRTGLPYCTRECRLPWREWFAESWSAVCARTVEEYVRMVLVHAHPKACQDYAEGLRASDPKRVAVYFLKHGIMRNKAYQHIVPRSWQGEGKGPGRFWGYWRIDRADRPVPITSRQADDMVRALRKWARLERPTRKVRVYRCNRTTGKVRYRTVTRRNRPLPRKAGFLVVNDGPAVAIMLSAVLRT